MPFRSENKGFPSFENFWTKAVRPPKNQKDEAEIYALFDAISLFLGNSSVKVDYHKKRLELN